MAGKITNGIEGITIDGVALGLTSEDTFSFTVDDNTSEQTFNVEESDEPIFTRKTGSKILGFTFVLANPDADALKTLFNGTDVDTGGVEIDGISHVTTKVPAEISSSQGWNISFSSVDVSATPDTAMGKNSLFGVVVEVKKNGGTITFEDPEDI